MPEQTMSDRYPNQVPERERSGYWHQDRYESGVIRDGHKVFLEEGALQVDHPEACEVDRRMSDVMFIDYDCPWTLAHEIGVKDCYAGQEDRLATITDEPVEINWSFNGGGVWTDYGWEFDSTFEWWLPGDETMQEPSVLELEFELASRDAEIERPRHIEQAARDVLRTVQANGQGPHA